MQNLSLLLSNTNNFATLFADDGVVTALCLAIGLIFCTIECFIPGFGFFGFSGASLIIFGIVYRMINGGNLWHLFYMFLIVILVMVIVILIAIRSARFGLLSKSPLIEKSTALPTDYSDDEKNYAFLLNKEGVVKTTCKPVGTAEIDGNIFQVVSLGKYIDEEKRVKVVSVEGETISVQEIKEETK